MTDNSNNPNTTVSPEEPQRYELPFVEPEYTSSSLCPDLGMVKWNDLEVTADASEAIDEVAERLISVIFPDITEFIIETEKGRI